MAIELATAGIKLGWAAEITENTRPTAGYVMVPGVKSIPSMNQEPETIEVTDLNDTVFRRYIPGLKDVGGALAFTAGLSQEFFNNWRAIIGKQDEVAPNNLQLWWQIWIPGLIDAFYFRGTATPLGMPEAAVNAALEIDAYVTPTLIPDDGWATASMPLDPTP